MDVFRVGHDDDDDDNDVGRLILAKKKSRPISLILVNTFNWIENRVNDILTIYMLINV